MSLMYEEYAKATGRRGKARGTPGKDMEVHGLNAQGNTRGSKRMMENVQGSSIGQRAGITGMVKERGRDPLFFCAFPPVFPVCS